MYGKPVPSCFLVLALLLLVNSAYAQKKISKEPLKFVDIRTRETIPEVLVIPRYGSAMGVVVPPEGLGKGGRVRDYLDHPFVYRSGQAFKVKRTSFIGLPLLFVFIGKFTEVEGVMFVAKGYFPVWKSELYWGANQEVIMRPIDDKAGTELVEREFDSLMKGSKKLEQGCPVWDLPQGCNLEIKFDRKERELVQSFLKRVN
jgi:hypothetical protein